MNNATKTTLGVLGATAVGAVAGILFAPAKGKDTRAKLRTQAKNAQSKTKDTMNQLSEKAKSKYNTISNQISEKVKANKEQILSSAKSVTKEVETELDALR